MIEKAIRQKFGTVNRGGRSDLFWLVHNDDVVRFSIIKRLKMGILVGRPLLQQRGRDLPREIPNGLPTQVVND